MALWAVDFWVGLLCISELSLRPTGGRVLEAGKGISVGLAYRMCGLPPLPRARLAPAPALQAGTGRTGMDTSSTGADVGRPSPDLVTLTCVTIGGKMHV